MDYVPEWTLKVTQPVFNSDSNLGKHGIRTVTFEVAEMAYGDFPLTILASAEIQGKRVLVGWVGFY